MYIMQGTGELQINLFKSTTVIGRNEVLTDKSLSRHHCSYSLITNTMTDTSKYGTWINTHKILAAHAINLNDTIKLGTKSTIFRVAQLDLSVCCKLSKDDTIKVEKLVQKTALTLTGISECAYLVMQEVVVTPKVLSALLRAIPIVRLEFFNAISDYSFPNFKDHSPALTQNDLCLYNPNPRRKNLFAGYVFVCGDYSEFKIYRQMIEIGGGTLLFNDSIVPANKLIIDSQALSLKYCVLNANNSFITLDALANWVLHLKKCVTIERGGATKYTGSVSVETIELATNVSKLRNQRNLHKSNDGAQSQSQFNHSLDRNDNLNYDDNQNDGPDDNVNDDVIDHYDNENHIVTDYIMDHYDNENHINNDDLIDHHDKSLMDDQAPTLKNKNNDKHTKSLLLTPNTANTKLKLKSIRDSKIDRETPDASTLSRVLETQLETPNPRVSQSFIKETPNQSQIALPSNVSSLKPIIDSILFEPVIDPGPVHASGFETQYTQELDFFDSLIESMGPPVPFINPFEASIPDVSIPELLIEVDDCIDEGLADDNSSVSGGALIVDGGLDTENAGLVNGLEQTALTPCDAEPINKVIEEESKCVGVEQTYLDHIQDKNVDLQVVGADCSMTNITPQVLDPGMTLAYITLIKPSIYHHRDTDDGPNYKRFRKVGVVARRCVSVVACCDLESEDEFHNGSELEF